MGKNLQESSSFYRMIKAHGKRALVDSFMIRRPSVSERMAWGKALRKQTPRAAPILSKSWSDRTPRACGALCRFAMAACLQTHWRQLADLKGSVAFERLETLPAYCGLCGWALALAHAKSGDPATIAGYCGKSSALDEAISKFATRYANQTEEDYGKLKKAKRSGRIKVALE
jgi:hypothetical protein